MFLSTIVQSSMLNVTENISGANYHFNLPYNFVRGRKICLRITPQTGHYTPNFSAYQAGRFLVNRLDNVTGAVPNCVYVDIPDNVTEHTITMTVDAHATHQSTTGGTPSMRRWRYTIEVLFNITDGIIKFTPVSFTNVVGTQNSIDQYWNVPVLITIATIM